MTDAEIAAETEKGYQQALEDILEKAGTIFPYDQANQRIVRWTVERLQLDRLGLKVGDTLPTQGELH